MKNLTANEIRTIWLNFWKERGHYVEPSASLIPHNDPTLLWINAGVAALKKYFDGSEIPANKRITNVQKSLRTNDIENVGMTARHHTFFEMLGNFSIGDYFRNEVIPWAFDLLTNEKYFGIDPMKLYITYHPDDEATKNLWIRCGMQEDHMIPLEDNFWCIGEGPCGPDTEIFFDRGEKYDPDHLGIRLLKEDIENDRYIEIWNIVFSQYNAQEGVARKDYKELPHKNIDTGGGLERFACIMQGAETNFETDLFLPIIKETEKLTKVPYEENKMAYRVIADHIRTCTFALSDGASFSNEGRGYVLRRILRRAMRYGRKLGIYEPFLYRLVDVVTDIMKDFYPYLLEHKERVKKTIYSEEVRFLKTLASGEQLLRKMMEDTSTLTGEEAFKLYDTYGFPIELTVEIASENGVKVDMDGFHDEMKKQKERARAARGDLQSMNRQSADLMSFTLPSEFDYESTNMEARIIGLFKDGKRVDVIEEEGDVIFDHTCFYSESGGQAPDKGTIMNGETEAEVLDVQKAPNHQFLHHVHLLYGTLHEGDILSLAIDTKKRYLTRKNHSSAHLLQSALRKVLGDHVHQEGSYVDDEIMRFDFSHSSKITDTELKEIEALVNGWINDAIEQKTLLLPIEEAKKTGATALFDEKYGDVVRVVTFGDVSKEFCGGTHVHNTAEIGCFAIEFEESIASGVRRIQARTGLKAYELLKKREALLADIQAMMKAGSYLEIQDRLKTLLHEKEVLALENHRLKEKEASFEAKQLENRFVMYNGVHLLAAYLNDTDRDGLMKRMDQLKTVYDDDVIVLIGGKDGNLPIVSHVSALAQKEGIRAGDLVKAVSGILGGSGGGRPEMASGGGKDASKIDEALAKVKELIA
ncbi:alanine--tRNA ligase [Coprobacillus sp. CAG:826]|nr:alanine--tRNA ligase [Coprobacillus sp. CAG:826]